MHYFDHNETYDSGIRYDDVTVPLTRKNMLAKLGLDRMNPGQKVTTVKAVKNAMTTNAATFNAPPVSMAATGTLITAAEDAITNVVTTDTAAKLALTQRDDAVAAMCAAAMQLVSYVEGKAAGNAATIELAGMGVRNPKAPIGALAQVLDLAVTASDHAGRLDWMCKPVKGAGSYEIWTSSDPLSDTSWSFRASSTKSSGTLGGFTSGAKMWVRVRAIGADADPGPWSDPAVKVVP